MKPPSDGGGDCDRGHEDIRAAGVSEAVALAQLGRPYSYTDFIRAGLGLAPGHEGEICSEYAAKVLRRAGVLASGYTPAGIVSSCLELGGEMRSVTR